MTEQTPPSWERATLERIALRALDEQRRARHWSTLIRLLWLTLFFLIVAAALGWIGSPSKEPLKGGKHTALVDLRGVIGMESKASADKINSALNAAFKDKNTKGVVLRINSPGGSPVQSGAINDEIRRLRAKHPEIPFHAVVQDLCASGGYYVAVAADRIYVDKASLVGSIGVIISGFGFSGAMEKLGIDRRAYTAGDQKDFLDPFAPENPAHKEHAKKMLEEIHQQFIKVVRDGRGKRLKDAPEIFSGLVWTGERAVELGLADALGSLDSVARDVIKAENVVDFTPDENYLEPLLEKAGRGCRGKRPARPGRDGGARRRRHALTRWTGSCAPSTRSWAGVKAKRRTPGANWNSCARSSTRRRSALRWFRSTASTSSSTAPSASFRVTRRTNSSGEAAESSPTRKTLPPMTRRSSRREPGARARRSRTSGSFAGTA